jgi:hypothetical protein
MFKGISNLVSSASNVASSAVNSAISKVHNPDAVETFEFEYEHQKRFSDIIKKYNKKFDPENLEKNNILSCVVTKTKQNGDIEIIQRHITFDLLKLPYVTIPETVLYYFPDTKITVEHNIKLNMKKKIMQIEVINITQPQLKFFENSSFTGSNGKTIYKIKATLSVNILFGVNETVRKLWCLQYKSYYDDYENKIKQYSNDE